MDLVECERCGREWDGLAQCDCFYNYPSDDDESYMKDVGTQSLGRKDGSQGLSIIIQILRLAQMKIFYHQARKEKPQKS